MNEHFLRARERFVPSIGREDINAHTLDCLKLHGLSASEAQLVRWVQSQIDPALDPIRTKSIVSMLRYAVEVVDMLTATDNEILLPPTPDLLRFRYADITPQIESLLQACVRSERLCQDFMDFIPASKLSYPGWGTFRFVVFCLCESHWPLNYQTFHCPRFYELHPNELDLRHPHDSALKERIASMVGAPPLATTEEQAARLILYSLAINVLLLEELREAFLVKKGVPRFILTGMSLTEVIDGAVLLQNKIERICFR